MADLKISQLNQLESLLGQELFPVANNGKNNSVSASVLRQALVISQILNGGGISITKNAGGKLVIGISEDTLQIIQNSDSEVKRLEKDKVKWEYDEATKTAINILLPLLGKLLGTDGENNYGIAGVGVYDKGDGTQEIQVEIGSPGLPLNLNSSERPTVEMSGEKKPVALLEDISASPVYPVDFSVLTSDSPASEDISTAIGGWDSLTAAINAKKLIVGFHPGKYTLSTHCEIMEEGKIMMGIHSEDVAIKIAILNDGGTLSVTRTNTALQKASDDTLATEDKTVAGAINEVKATTDSLSETVGGLEEALNGVEEALKSINNERI